MRTLVVKPVEAQTSTSTFKCGHVDGDADHESSYVDHSMHQEIQEEFGRFSN